MLTIRCAAEADAKSVHGLIELLEAPQKFPFTPFFSNYRKNLADPALVYLVAEDEGDVVAFGSLSFSTPLHHMGPVAEIVELVVDERCRGRSVGAGLIDAMLLQARERECCSLEVTSNKVRTRAHRFYEKHGFLMSHCKLTQSVDYNTGRYDIEASLS